MRRFRTDLPDHVYPDDPWALVEDTYSPRFLYLTETIMALSNGYLGLRATIDEGTPAHRHGTFVNGFHETWPIVHPENAYGFARVGQTIVNVPDATVIRVSVDGEAFEPSKARRFRRWLDFRQGVLERVVTWTTGSGTTVSMWNRRLVSLVHREHMAFATRIEVDRPARIEIDSRVINRQDADPAEMDDDDPRRAAWLPHKVLEPRAATIEATRLVQTWATASSRMELVVAVDHRLDGAVGAVEHERVADNFGFRFAFDAEPDKPIDFTKHAVYLFDPAAEGIELRLRAEEALNLAIGFGFAGLAAAQEHDLGRFWAHCDIEVAAGREVQRAVRWTLFQLYQASAQLSGRSIPAKGLTGQAYDGHYFWDTEIYVCPFLIYSAPDKAAEILRFRYELLPKARARARELSVGGALFPWRTISGDEASAYFLAGTAQYHIDADIVYALRKYVSVTHDDELLWDIGVELAIETARMWHDLGFFRGNRFHIHGVTGPDEYAAMVDDNAYTNAMARMNLRFAADVATRMTNEAPERADELFARLELGPDEITAWRIAADAMYIPYDPELGITPQDEGFLLREPWDFEGTPPSKYPLLLHFHPLVIYRYQVLKQADVVLADFLLGDEFAAEIKKTNFEHYDPITTGDSSLSACVQAIMASEIGRLGSAERHFDHALFMDLADLGGNTTDGVHMASAGGVWMAIVYGFGGLRDHGGHISFDPKLPSDWNRLRFRLMIRGRRLVVDIERTRLTLQLDGDPLELQVSGRPVLLEDDSPVEFPLDPRAEPIDH